MSTGAYDERDAERMVVEPDKVTERSAFARDRARVLHSFGLRRLAAKTQVVVSGVLDFPRTRLTHTLEVAQIGRELGAAIGCDPDLVDVAGLTHDLGHPPFGHNGETELDRIADDIGGFEGNAQTLRVLTRLEAKIFDAEGNSAGLNLSRASLDASCKYPWARKPGLRKFGVYADDMPVFKWLREGSVGERTCLEEQVMDWADDVAYSVHDAEDAVHAGMAPMQAFGSPHVRATIVEVANRRFCPDTDPARLHAAIERLVALPAWPRAFDGSMASLVELKTFTSALIGRFCWGAQVATRAAYGPGPLTRYSAELVVPDDLRDEVAVMKAIAAHFVIERAEAQPEYARQREVLAEVVDALNKDEGRSLEPWIKPAYVAATSDEERRRVVIDQVASLTDTSVMQWHTRLVG